MEIDEKAEWISVAVNGDIYVADTGNAAIRKITPAGVVATINLSLSALVITSQPAGLTVVAGAAVSFTVIATGSNPLSCQWNKDGAAIPGATSASFAKAAVTTSDAGIIQS